MRNAVYVGEHRIDGCLYILSRGAAVRAGQAECCVHACWQGTLQGQGVAAGACDGVSCSGDCERAAECHRSSIVVYFERVYNRPAAERRIIVGWRVGEIECRYFRDAQDEQSLVGVAAAG